MKNKLMYILLLIITIAGLTMFFIYKDKIIANIKTNNTIVEENNNQNNKEDVTDIEETVEENNDVLDDNKDIVIDEKEDENSNIDSETITSDEKTDEPVIYDFSYISTYKEENNERYINYNNNNLYVSDEEIVKRVNLYLDYNFYNHDIESINKYTSLVLVNKFFYLDENYIPNNLIKININYASNSNLYGESEAVNHFENMCLAAKEDGLTIKAMSTYRSYTSQSAIYNNYLKSDTQANVDTYSARPGHSEHQTGLAFDVYNGSVSFTSFGSTNEYRWVKDNAYKYGFIIRYTETNKYITGYSSEPWHLRYVGIDAATYIYNNNITLEEYLLNKK